MKYLRMALAALALVVNAQASDDIQQLGDGIAEVESPSSPARTCCLRRSSGLH